MPITKQENTIRNTVCNKHKWKKKKKSPKNRFCGIPFLGIAWLTRAVQMTTKVTNDNRLPHHLLGGVRTTEECRRPARV